MCGDGILDIMYGQGSSPQGRIPSLGTEQLPRRSHWGDRGWEVQGPCQGGGGYPVSLGVGLMFRSLEGVVEVWSERKGV